MLCPSNVLLRRSSSADIGQYLADVHRQSHPGARLRAIRPRRLRYLVANRQGCLHRPVGHLVKRQWQPKGDNVQ
jgi:hypothetical protein